jgi:Ran GTPase-activating protein (RanGAP) involved in mRNA processing and transport
MPENENIIPEAEVVETVEQVANPISFSPVTKDEDDIVVEQQEEIIPEQADVIQEEQVEEVAETQSMMIMKF